MESGWIKLHRSLINKGYYKKSKIVHLWVHCLLRANHKPTEIMWNGKTLMLNKGQFITGRKALGHETGISQSSVQRILKFLEIEHQIEQQTNNRSRLITITNWNQYQMDEQQGEHLANNKRTTGEHLANTDKNDKKDKNVKNDKNTWLTPFWDCWKETYDGDMDAKKWVRVLKPLIKQHGEADTLKAFSNYIQSIEIQFHKPNTFQSAFGQYLKGSTHGQPKQHNSGEYPEDIKVRVISGSG